LIKFEFEEWTKVFYDLKNLRREIRKEPDISKFDEIIHEVKTMNPRIDLLEKNVSTKMQVIEKEI
jgi:hypothetical protein